MQKSDMVCGKCSNFNDPIIKNGQTYGRCDFMARTKLATSPPEYVGAVLQQRGRIMYCGKCYNYIHRMDFNREGGYGDCCYAKATVNVFREGCKDFFERNESVQTLKDFNKRLDILLYDFQKEKGKYLMGEFGCRLNFIMNEFQKFVKDLDMSEYKGSYPDVNTTK
jgi:hypothetical protein